MMRHTLPLKLLTVVVAVGCAGAELPAPYVNAPPTVTIVTPELETTISKGDTVRITVEASDSNGVVAAVAFHINGDSRATDTEAPFEFVWNTSDAIYVDHEIRVVAVDDEGAFSEASLDVAVDWAYRQPEHVLYGWQTGSLNEVGVDVAPIDDLMRRLRSIPDTLVHSVLIVKDGILVLEEYLEGKKYTNPEYQDAMPTFPFHRDTVHNIASITKSVTSALLGIAIDIGLIDSVECRAAEFFPEIDAFQEAGKNEITLEHLVTMSSGLEWDQHAVGLTDPENDIVWFYTSTNPVASYAGRPLVAEPGSLFVYSEASINTVARAIERASGMLLDEFAAEYLFGPLGIDDARWLIIREGFVWASGNLAITPRSMAKIGQLYLDRGVWNGERIVSSEWIDRSAAAFHTFDGPWRYGYGYAWWLDAYDDWAVETIAGHGLGGQRIHVIPALNAVVILTGGCYWIPPVTHPDLILDNYIIPALR